MTRQPFELFVAQLALVAACASGGNATASPLPAVTSPTSAPLTFPHSVEAFVEQNREQYDNPALGVRVGYITSGGLRADAYVYPVASIPDTSREGEQATARAEAVEAAAVLCIFEQRGVYSDVMLADPEGLNVTGPSGHRMEGSYVAASLRQQNQPVRSDIYVFVLRRQYLKIRATYPSDESSDVSRSAIRTFAVGLVVSLDASATK